MKTRAIYAGSFDLLTVGHTWMIERGAELFDELIIGIGTNPKKSPVFDIAERKEMISEATANIDNIIDIAEYKGYLFNFAEDCLATHLLRGIRNNADFEYERNMRNINGDLDPELQSVFLMPPREISEVSSSTVKGMVGPQGWEEVVKRYVPDNVYPIILQAVIDGRL